LPRKFIGKDKLKNILLISLLFSFVLTGCAQINRLGYYLPMMGGNLGDFLTTGEAEWELDNGLLNPLRGEANGYVYTKRVYTDFEMSMSFYIESETNSGVYTHCMDPDVITTQGCFEFNIWDQNTNPDNRTGAIVNIAPPLVEVPTIDKWNTLIIRSEDGHQQMYVNDQLTADIQDDRFQAGHIALQYGGANGMVQFRDIEIKVL
jgi:hypothetical protein